MVGMLEVNFRVDFEDIWRTRVPPPPCAQAHSDAWTSVETPPVASHVLTANGVYCLERSVHGAAVTHVFQCDATLYRQVKRRCFRLYSVSFPTRLLDIRV